MDKLIEKKTVKDFPRSIKNTLRLLTLNWEYIIPSGSYLYRSQKYADIDEREVISFCECGEDFNELNTKIKISKKLTRMIQEMVYRITQDPNLLFSNFKTGDIKWTSNEILQGHKIVGQDDIWLQDTIFDNEVMNTEVWKMDGGRWIELSNFIVPQYIDQAGRVHNIIKNIGIYEDQIKNDIKHYWHINRFKAIKRLWIIARITENNELIRELQALLSSNAIELYLIISDLKTIFEILDQYSASNINERHYENIQNRLAMIYEINIDHGYYDDVLNVIINYLMPKKEIQEFISAMIEKLLEALNDYTEQYVENSPNIIKNLHQYI